MDSSLSFLVSSSSSLNRRSASSYTGSTVCSPILNFWRKFCGALVIALVKPLKLIGVVCLVGVYCKRECPANDSPTHTNLQAHPIHAKWHAPASPHANTTRIPRCRARVLSCCGHPIRLPPGPTLAVSPFPATGEAPCPLCDVRCAVCSARCALFSLRWALRSLAGPIRFGTVGG